MMTCLSIRLICIHFKIDWIEINKKKNKTIKNLASYNVYEV